MESMPPCIPAAVLWSFCRAGGYAVVVLYVLAQRGMAGCVPIIYSSLSVSYHHFLVQCVCWYQLAHVRYAALISMSLQGVI